MEMIIVGAVAQLAGAATMVGSAAGGVSRMKRANKNIDYSKRYNLSELNDAEAKTNRAYRHAMIGLFAGAALTVSGSTIVLAARLINAPAPSQTQVLRP